MATIPTIQSRLADLITEIRELTDEAEALVDELSRRKPAKRARATARPMTETVRAQIRATARQNPDMSQREIAEKLKINPGRVSETLRGKRR